MTVTIEVRHDRVRGCGWRKEGGLYLISGGVAAPCGKLPIPLDRCPTCSHGIKPTRAWTWIDADALLAGAKCDYRPEACMSCPLSQKLGRVGLLWVGGSFYKTPADWTQEAIKQGVSRRIPALPKSFKLGETWVLIAHREAITRAKPYNGEPLEPGQVWNAEEKVPGIFHAFKPTAVEYVVKGDETEEQLAAMVKRGITPIRVERDEEQPALRQTLDHDPDEWEVDAMMAERAGGKAGA